MGLCPSKIRAALHEETLQVTQIVEEKIVESNSFVLRKIPDGGVVDHHANHETIIYGQAFQPFREYNAKNYADGPLVSGEMNAAGCAGVSTTFETDINDVVDNACSGETIIDFAQGFRRRGFHDFDIKPKTPIHCAAELSRKGPQYVRAFWKAWSESFTRWGMDNFEANLQNQVIRYGEANASVQGADYFDVTAGGFVAPPTSRLSIWFLEQYRDYLVFQGGLDKNDYLEIEMPQQDWLDAVRYHQIQTLGANAQFSTQLYKDEVGPFKGREFGTWGNIKCYFNERPIKGYFKQTGISGGKPTYQFVRIYPWINEPGEEGGVVARPNHDYRKAKIVCEGVTYDLCILAFVVNEKSFKRYGKNTDIKPNGTGAIVPNNYSVVVRDGAWLAGEACGNDYDEKFRLVARHQYRLSVPYPEFSGAIAYRAAIVQGYEIPVCNNDPSVPESKPASAQVFDPAQTGPLPCQVAVCEDCGFDTANSSGECVNAPADAVVQFVPCGTLLTSYTGTTHQVLIRVRRVGVPEGVATVDYTITDTPGSGLATTPEHYNDVSDDPGTITWADGDGADKFIKLNIVGASGDADLDLTATLALTNPSANLALSATCASLVMTIEDLSV